MPKVFDKKQALNALNKTDSIIKAIENTQMAFKKHEQNAITQIKKITERNQLISFDPLGSNGIIDTTTEEEPSLLSELVSKELLSGDSIVHKNKEILYTFILMDRYLTARSIYGSAEPQLNELYSNIKKATIDLQESLNASSFKKVLMGSSKRQVAENAFVFLKEVIESELALYPNHIIESLNTISGRSKQESLKNYAIHRKYFCEVMKEMVPAIASEDDSINQSISCIIQEKSFKSLNDSIKKTKTNLINNIKTSIEEYIDIKTTTILKTIPVDDLTKSISGIRIKPLKDAGIFDFATIHNMSSYRLENINGISSNSAYTISRIVNDYYNNISRDIKLKLNYDNRSLNETKIVESIYAFKSAIGELNETQSECENIIKKVEKALSFIEEIKSGYDWLIFTQSEKHKYIVAGKYIFYVYNDLYENYKAKANPGAFSSPTDAWNDFRKKPIEYYNIIEEIFPNILGGEDGSYGLPEDVFNDIQKEKLLLDNINCKLRPYQVVGVKYILHQKKVLLGDEMGLGKTIQALAAMVTLHYTFGNRFMVVCPASVLPNWIKEISNKCSLRPIKIHGESKRYNLLYWENHGGIAVTTYETTRFIVENIDDLIDFIVVDEAHYIKNPNALRSKNVEHLCKSSKRILLMTGTALENNVFEMINLIRILDPDIAARVECNAFIASAPQFREKIATVYYRRKREEVLNELPDLIESKEWCSLTYEEERIYEEAVLEKNYHLLRRVSWNVENIANSSKAKRMVEIIEEAKNESRKVLIFSFFLRTIASIRGLLGDKCLEPITGSVSPAKRQSIIDDFEKAPDGAVLLAQIQSGGTGLNIQSASVVIICEPQLKPSIENQAISRAYRLGQSRNVLVYRLLCEDTIDEKLIDLLSEKQRIFDAFADKSVAAEKDESLVEIDDKSFSELVEEEIQRINAKSTF